MSRSKHKGPFFKVNLITKNEWIQIYNKNLTIYHLNNNNYNQHQLS